MKRKPNKYIVIGVIFKDGKIDSHLITTNDYQGHNELWPGINKRWRYYPKLGFYDSVYGDFITEQEREKIMKHIMKEYGIKIE